MSPVSLLQRLKLLLRECSNDMWQSIVRPFAIARTELDLLPFACLKKPFVGGSRDVATGEEGGPDDVDGFCSQSGRAAPR